MSKSRLNPSRPWASVRPLLAALAALMVTAGAVQGQAVTGNLYGTVTDPQGSALPGVTVTLEGFGAERAQITDAEGAFRFLGLDPGEWRVVAELEGMGGVEYDGVAVAIGRNTTIQLVIAPSIEETVSVMAESPLLDERKLTAGTQIRQVELEKIPTGRDPWAILNQTPGVVVARVHVAGSEAGQQSAFRAPGVEVRQNDFLLDGLQITDMRATGASSTYYDFDQFAEMQFSTGGTDVTKNTAGVSVNLVTKRGGGEFRGSARFFNVKANGYLGGGLRQSQPNVDAGDMGPGQRLEDYRGAQIREIEEVGFEAGGPLVRDRLWLWGSWSENDIRQIAASGTNDDTILENTALKLNAQPVQNNSVVVSWNNGDKLKFGRDAGVTRPEETTKNQRGPSAIYRFEDSHVFSSRLFVAGTYAIGDLGFQVAARGGVGPSAPESWRRSDGVWQDNWISGGRSSDNEELKLDGSYFYNTGGVGHELRIGGRVREYVDSDAFAWPGRDVFRYNTTATSFVVAKRGIQSPVAMEYESLWAQDTVSFGRVTLNAGLRFDRQTGVNDAATVPANPAVPNVLPAIEYPGLAEEFDWTTVAPRMGVTYALGRDRDTLIRASLSRFADQLGVNEVSRTNPTGYAYAYFVDPTGTEGPPPADMSIFDDPSRVVFPNGFDPAAPAALSDPDVNDPGLDAPVTTELLAAVEHAVRPELVVGLNLTWREISDILEEREFVSLPDGSTRTVTADDYRSIGFATGTVPIELTGGAPETYSRELFGLRPGTAFTGGALLINGSRERVYRGAALTVTKRLANRWMLRGYVNWGEAEWRVDDEYLFNSDPNRNLPGGDRDGDVFMTLAGGGGRGVRYLQSSFTSNLNGMVQIAPDRPWGFNLSTSAQWRDGHAVPLRLDGQGTQTMVLVSERPDSYRLDDVMTVDLRVEKEFALSGPLQLTFGLDAFNVTNEGTELSRNNNVDTGTAFHLFDNVSPRIYRLSVRLGWR